MYETLSKLSFMSFADRIIAFNHQLRYDGDPLPEGIRIMNPFQESPQALRISDEFYRKFCDDDFPRSLILGINPGRFGAGLTGIPFTDPKLLKTHCHIDYMGHPTHEPSSVFIYEVIDAFGGPGVFYKAFHINSLCPLGFVKADAAGREKNYNYYDDTALQHTVEPLIIKNIRDQINLGTQQKICICLGNGNNERYLRKLNDRYHFFEKIIGLEHPRFVMQYKSKQKQFYIDKYLEALAISNGQSL